VDRGF